ncbi:hypothetical protein CW304_02645 [Bacillus sp. UFRGS-B20]|nr:hypothetical protein CW304_02645 [Bacillus sp. UFRGS-B20]
MTQYIKLNWNFHKRWIKAVITTIINTKRLKNRVVVYIPLLSHPYLPLLSAIIDSVMPHPFPKIPPTFPS